MKDLEGKVAFITGGASGIGLAMATTFLEAGMKVVIADIRKDRLQRADTILKKISDDIRAVEVDTANLESIERAADQAEVAFGKVHILCNNAGIGAGGSFLDASLEQWRQVLGINLWGVIYGIQVFLPRMLNHGEGGHIVNTASITGMYPTAVQPIYGTSKFAIVGLSEFLRKEMENENVSISALCPFVVDTPIFYPDLDPDDTEGIAKRKQARPALFEKLAVKPEVVGEQVLRAIQTNEFYIYCDGVESREMVKSRAQDMLDAFDRQFPQ